MIAWKPFIIGCWSLETEQPGFPGFTLFTIDMQFYKFLLKSSIHFEKHPHVIEKLELNNIFSLGAKWMHTRLQEFRGHDINEFTIVSKYNFYGFLKYLVLAHCFVISTLVLYHIDVVLLPLVILIFYFVEVHFLFLFPLLIDKAENPIKESVRLSYKIGIIKAIWNVIPISFFMIIGLFNYKKPLRNWYLGCLAVLIWYEEAIGNRI